MVKPFEFSYNMVFFRSHLNNRQIVTKNPEEIRGGGLLRYCNLITRGFKVIEDDNTNKLQTLERFHEIHFSMSEIRVPEIVGHGCDFSASYGAFEA